MTQQEALQKRVEMLLEDKQDIVRFINEYVAEVIGKDDSLHWTEIEDKYGRDPDSAIRSLLTQQRKRAGLDKEGSGR